MTTLVKIHRKGQMTLPSSFRTAMGLGEGSLVELSLKNGKAIMSPQIIVDRSKFPTADDEYTPAQRRIIDAGIAKGLADIKAGRVSKAFSSGEEFLADLHKAAKKLTGKKIKQPVR